MSKLLDPISEKANVVLSVGKDLEQFRYDNVKTILVVLSSHGLVLDLEALRQAILFAYCDSVIFFQSTSGAAMGAKAPKQIDLVIDFVGRKQKQKHFFVRKLKKKARFIVGRNNGLYRKYFYSRIYSEKACDINKSESILDYELYVQKCVLALAGVALVPNAPALEPPTLISDSELYPWQK